MTTARSSTATAGHRGGPIIAGLAGLALLVALYLTAVKLSGGSPVCGPLVGCDTVNSSPYSEFIGVPVALFGAAGAALMLSGALAWWRLGWRPGLLIAYLVGLASLPVLAYLTYLELFVIGAVCAWCVAYAVFVIAAWLVSLRAMRLPATEES